MRCNKNENFWKWEEEYVGQWSKDTSVERVFGSSYFCYSVSVPKSRHIRSIEAKKG